MTKEEIYNKATAINLGEYPLGTRMDVVYSAMDLFAKDQSIAFGQFLSENNYRPFDKMGKDHWLQGGMSVSIRLPDLYEKFLQQQLLK